MSVEREGNVRAAFLSEVVVDLGWGLPYAKVVKENQRRGEERRGEEKGGERRKTNQMQNQIKET